MGTTVTDSSDTSKRNADDTRRDARYRLRAWLWDLDPKKPVRAPQTRLRVSSCGRTPVAGYVSVRGGSGAASLGGVSTCGSVWICPVCAPKVAGQRSLEVQDAIRAHQATGGSVMLMTLTLAHKSTDPLATVWDAISAGWSAVRNGSGWKADTRDHGIVGYCRIIEVTHSTRNGWHPHVHVLLFVTGTPTKADCEALRARVYDRWSSRLVRDGFKTLDFDKHGKAVGVDVRLATAHTVAYLADYLSKFGYQPKGDATSLALEASRGDLKRGRKGSRTPWELAELARDGQRRALALWQEWERTSHGRRQYAWAQGFRESLDLAGVLSDQEAVEREDLALDTKALLTRDAWRKLVADLLRKKDRPGSPLLSRLLSVAATGTAADVLTFCADNGVEAVSVESETPDGYSSLAGVWDEPHTIRMRREQARRRDRTRHEAAARTASDQDADNSHHGWRAYDGPVTWGPNTPHGPCGCGCLTP